MFGSMSPAVPSRRHFTGCVEGQVADCSVAIAPFKIMHGLLVSVNGVRPHPFRRIETTFPPSAGSQYCSQAAMSARRFSSASPRR